MTTTNKLLPGSIFLVNDTTGEFFGLRINDKEIAIPSSAPAPGGGYVGLTLLAADGTAAAPSYSFTSDSNTGFFSSGAGQIGGAIDGTQRFRFTANDFRIESDTGAIFMGSSGDLIAARDGANIWAQRNGTAAQSFRLYNKFTDASNYERGAFDWGTTYADIFTIGTFAAGTGVTRDFALRSAKDLYLGANSALRVRLTNTTLTADTNGLVALGEANTGYSKLYIDYTNTATVGAVTINKAAGRVNIAAAATSIVVTNSLVTAATKVFAVPVQADANNPLLRSVVPAAGSFTITVSAAPAANQAWDFFIVNAD